MWRVLAALVSLSVGASSALAEERQGIESEQVKKLGVLTTSILGGVTGVVTVSDLNDVRRHRKLARSYQQQAEMLRSMASDKSIISGSLRDQLSRAMGAQNFSNLHLLFADDALKRAGKFGTVSMLSGLGLLYLLNDSPSDGGSSGPAVNESSIKRLASDLPAESASAPGSAAAGGAKLK